MPFETEPTNEQSPSELLKQIEASGNYLFHGSPYDLAELKPAKPKGDMSDKEFNKTESLYVTSSATRAIVSATMPKGKNIERGTLQDDEGHVTLRCKLEVFNQIKPGFVYVLGNREQADKDEDGPSHQFKYDKSQTPNLVIPVSIDDFQDLGGKIEIVS